MVALPPKVVALPTKVVAQQKICTSIAKGIPCSHGSKCRFSHTPVVETVIRVPAELALQAMEMAIKSGMVNVRVEIV